MSLVEPELKRSERDHHDDKVGVSVRHSVDYGKNDDGGGDDDDEVINDDDDEDAEERSGEEDEDEEDAD